MIGPKLSHTLTEIAGVPVEQLHYAITIYRAHYAATGIAQSRLYPGVRDLLESFTAAGRPVAVATQKPEGLARTVLEHHGIAGHFGTIRGSAADETAGAAAGAAAGKTEIVAAALADLKAQSAGELLPAVMVGDRAQDVAGAAANGLDCIGVGWGFAPDGELHEAGAVEIVHTTADLHQTILRRDAAGTGARTAQPQATAAAAGILPADTPREVHTDGNV
ncbi:MAG: haloacid dehalogenase [Arthrobacter sp.]|nr:haloacid dehalogenase [Arthrobacter sp.]